MSTSDSIAQRCTHLRAAAAESLIGPDYYFF